MLANINCPAENIAIRSTKVYIIISSSHSVSQGEVIKVEHCHSLLSKPAILENLGKGIIIDPFNPDQLRTCSHDVRLGECYFRRHGPNDTGDLLFNPYDPEMVRRHYGEAQIALLAADITHYKPETEFWRYIKPEHRVITM